LLWLMFAATIRLHRQHANAVIASRWLIRILSPNRGETMLAREAHMVAIDFEATGVVGQLPSEPWQIGMVRMAGGVIDVAGGYNRLLHVGDRPFNPYAPGQHHQLRAELAAAPALAQLWPELQHWWLGTPLIAHNIGTERTFLSQVAPMHSFGPWIDTLQIARHVYPTFASHTLEDLVDHLRLTDRVVAACPGLLPHDAFFDAVACAVLLDHCLHLPGWEEVTLEALANVSASAYHRSRRRGAQNR